MKIVEAKQTWAGFFTYQEGYEVIDQYLKVAFSMELIFNGTSFTGTSRDVESENFFDEPTKVKGFIENNTISFVLNYPCSYYKDEMGNIVLDRDATHPDIEYLGYYDDDEKTFFGTWEMIIAEEKDFDDYIEAVISGGFEIRRIK